MQTVTLLLIVTLGLLNALQKPIQIAAIFDHDANMRHDLMFVNAVKSVNRLPGLLRGVTLVPVIQKIPPDNSFIAERAACQVLSKGVAAVLGPQSRHNSEHIKSLCDNSEVPYIETLSPGSSTPGPGPRYTSINLHPDPGQLGHVLVSLVKRYGWSKVALLYEDNRSLVSLRALLDLTATSEGRLQLVTRQLILDRVEGYRTVLRELSDTGARHIVLACSKEILWDVLNQAQQIGLVTQQVNWILTNLDAHTVDFRPFKYDFTNFTLLRIVDFSRPFVQYSLHSIVREEIMMGRTLDFTEFSGGLDTEAALIYDAVHLFAVALSQVRQVQDLRPASIHCERLNDRPEEDDRDPGHKQFWQHGSTIINFMRLSTIPGLSGTVKFDSWGRRSEFSLDLLNLFEEQGLARVGGWEIEGGVTLSGLPVEGAGSNEPQNPMMNKSLVVTTILNPPYTMIKEESGVLYGNDRYEGFIPEMVDIMSKILQFNVSLRIVADGQYGGFDGSRWNGMMREVLVGEADMAVADLSITTKRADAVEFSMPWMNLGISIIYMKPKKAPPGLLMFLEPFGIDVWIATLISILLVAMFTFVIGRFSPYEWFNPNFCIMAPDELETQWNLNNSLWHTVGALMQQGTDFCPVSLSARFLVGIFYFFTLILLSSYTANLAASLTAETLNRPITSAEDLAEQTQIK